MATMRTAKPLYRHQPVYPSPATLKYQRRVGALVLPMMVIEWLERERKLRSKPHRKTYRLAELLWWNYSPKWR
jgi:hypothetical protein